MPAPGTLDYVGFKRQRPYGVDTLLGDFGQDGNEDDPLSPSAAPSFQSPDAPPPEIVDQGPGDDNDTTPMDYASMDYDPNTPYDMQDPLGDRDMGGIGGMAPPANSHPALDAARTHASSVPGIPKPSKVGGVLAGIAGGLSGWVNAAGRTHVNAQPAIEGLRYGQYPEKMRRWQAEQDRLDKQVGYEQTGRRIEAEDATAKARQSAYEAMKARANRPPTARQPPTPAIDSPERAQKRSEWAKSQNWTNTSHPGLDSWIASGTWHQPTTPAKVPKTNRQILDEVKAGGVKLTPQEEKYVLINGKIPPPRQPRAGDRTDLTPVQKLHQRQSVAKTKAERGKADVKAKNEWANEKAAIDAKYKNGDKWAMGYTNESQPQYEKEMRDAAQRLRDKLQRNENSLKDQAGTILDQELPVHDYATGKESVVGPSVQDVPETVESQEDDGDDGEDDGTPTAVATPVTPPVAARPPAASTAPPPPATKPLRIKDPKSGQVRVFNNLTPAQLADAKRKGFVVVD